MAMGILRRWRWEVDRPDSSNAVASSKLAELLGMAMAGWHFADGIETALNRAVSAAGEKEGAAPPNRRPRSDRERGHRPVPVPASGPESGSRPRDWARRNRKGGYAQT